MTGRANSSKGASFLKANWGLLLVLIITLASLWLMRGLSLSPDVADLLPDNRQGEALRLYSRAFGGADTAMVLLRGQAPAEVQAAADDATQALKATPHAKAVVNAVELDLQTEPSLAWAFAAPSAQRALEHALTPERMRKRLQETRRLLLAPGAASMASTVGRDPLRLSSLALQGNNEQAPLHGRTGALVADDGRARMLLLRAAGQSLKSGEAHAFVASVEKTLASVRARHPQVSIRLGGGHAVAVEAERMLRRDLQLSGVASTLLAVAAFWLTFRRARALLAVMPPVLLGTLWTAGLAGARFEHLSAISLAFVAVVVGVGVDTGVHVYGALLEGRRAGLEPEQAARQARRQMARPTLLAALAAAAAFGALGLSQIRALRQLGLLCAAGELLTAVAILLITPAVGALLEKGKPPAARSARVLRKLGAASQKPYAPAVLAVAFAMPLLALGWFGLPKPASAIVAMRAPALETIRLEDDIQHLFGTGAGQWVVLVNDESEERARTRADRLFEALEASPHVDQIDGLARLAPSTWLQQQRLTRRDELNLPARASLLEQELQQAGFAVGRFAGALNDMRHPASEVRDRLAGAEANVPWLRARYLASDAGRSVAVLYVRPKPGGEQWLQQQIEQLDPGAAVTGFARLDQALRATLASDLPKIALASALLVALAMAGALRRVRSVVLVLAVLVFEVAWVLVLARWSGMQLHAYNALILPVLLGVTVDEAMFLLHRAKRSEGVEQVMMREGPYVVTTALTTAAGMAALLLAKFDGLRDLGWIGTTGVLVGLVAALVVVPIGLKLQAGPSGE